VSGGVFAIRLSVKRRIGAELDTAYGQIKKVTGSRRAVGRSETWMG
jgi:hypothetical protein